MNKAREKAKELQKHTKLPCEKDEKCLMIIPLKLGMQIFGVLNIFGFVCGVLGIPVALTEGVLQLFMQLISVAINGYFAMLWYDWFQKDNKETTGKIVRFTKMMYVLGCVITVVFSALCILVGAYKAGIMVIFMIFMALINITLTIAVGWYFFQVTVRYHVNNYGKTEHDKVFK